MWFDLTLEARDGSRHHVSYNPHTSECEGLSLPVEPGIFAQVARVAKDKPLGKSRAPRILKIQLGLSCNYACSYCSQAFQIADATVSKLADVEHFLTQLDGWITDAPEKTELWGGEPFLYWAKIKRLIPALAERFPAARFSIVTNGSILSREKLDFIAKHDVEITISHDGPGQHLRGPDPFDDPERRRWIEALLAERPEKTGFNAVLTRQHHDLRALKAWFSWVGRIEIKERRLRGIALGVTAEAAYIGAGFAAAETRHELKRTEGFKLALHLRLVSRLKQLRPERWAPGRKLTRQMDGRLDVPKRIMGIVRVEPVGRRKPVKLEAPPARIIGWPGKQIRIADEGGVNGGQNVKARVAVELCGVNVRQEVLIEGLPQDLLIELHGVVADPDRGRPAFGQLGHLLRKVQQ